MYNHNRLQYIYEFIDSKFVRQNIIYKTDRIFIKIRSTSTSKFWNEVLTNIYCAIKNKYNRWLQSDGRLRFIYKRKTSIKSYFIPDFSSFFCLSFVRSFIAFRSCVCFSIDFCSIIFVKCPDLRGKQILKKCGSIGVEVGSHAESFPLSLSLSLFALSYSPRLLFFFFFLVCPRCSVKIWKSTDSIYNGN